MCKNKLNYFYVNLGKIVEPTIKIKKKEKIKRPSKRTSGRYEEEYT